MSNSFFDWTQSPTRFVPRDFARAEDVNEALDSASQGFEDVELALSYTFRLAPGTGNLQLSLTPGQRANKLLGFDAAGDLTALPIGGQFRGDWATGVAYLKGDTLRYDTDGLVLAVLQNHTSTTVNADLSAGKLAILFDGSQTADLRDQAQAAATSAQDWAIKMGSPVSGGEYSAKYHATAASNSASNASGSASSASTDAAKAADWAKKAEDSPVEAGQFSALHWAAKASASALSASSSASEATDWATKMGSPVSGGDYSAKYYASQTGADVAKAHQWASEDHNVVVESGQYSAKHWAIEAANVVSGGVTWSTISGKPAVVAEGATQADARSAIDAASATQGSHADTAYGWGNHATAGYLTSHQDISGLLPKSGGTMTGVITFAGGQTWPTFNQDTTGSAAKLTTARTLTIGSTGRTFDGSADATWSLADIGAAPANTTLTDAAADSTLPSTSSSALTALLQTVRNCLKWLIANTVQLTGAQTVGGVKTFTARSSHAGAYTPSATPAHSATPTFDCSTSNVFEPAAMTGNVTSMTLSNAVVGQTVMIRFVQDGTGGRTVALPSGAKVAGSMPSGANMAAWLTMVYSSRASRWEGSWTEIPA